MSEQSTFDYVIIGAGSAGCVVANRLSEDPKVSVCLLEAGPPDRSPTIHVPLLIVKAMSNPLVNWLYWSKPQPHAGQRPAFMPRGKTLGGTSAINGMVYMRGNPHDYDDWAAAGNPGWSWNEVKPYFLKSENNQQYGAPHHAQGGPLNVTYIPDPNPANNTLAAAAATLGYAHNPDCNGDSQEGFGVHQVTQRKGRRETTATAFLHPIRQRGNLTVITDAPVDRVIVDNRRASGVLIADNQRRTIHARREVILCAGAITSPVILQRSGIGDPEDMAQHGIDIKHALPGVGKNLQEHVSVHAQATCQSRKPYGLSLLNLPRIAWWGIDYLLRRRGLFASNMVEGGGFIKTDPGLDRPDIQYVFMPGHKPDPPRTIGYGHGYQLISVLLQPKSRGSVSLSSTDPQAAPLIDPNFFSAEDDLEKLLAGYKESRRILNAAPFQAYRPTEILPGADVQSDEQLREHIRNNSATIFHPVGSCKMGNDEMAVVDARLRVHGIAGLRVADASIMPTIPSGNTNAPSIMIGEKASDLIREDARSQD